MRHHVTLRSYRTGSIETPRAVRHSLAFDLRTLAFADGEVIAAELRLPTHLAGRGVHASLRVPATDISYGEARRGTRRVRLNTEALGDLRASAGAFFSLDALVRDENGRPVTVPAGKARAITLTVERAAISAAAAA